MYILTYMYSFAYSGTSQARNSSKKSETSSEELSARVVCLDDSLSAPRSRTWRTCFYILLFISQPEQNI